MTEGKFEVLARSLKAILTSIKGENSDLDTDDIAQFIDVGEFGLALEFIRDTIIEYDIKISDQLLDQMSHAADLMHSRQTMITRALKEQVRREV